MSSVLRSSLGRSNGLAMVGRSVGAMEKGKWSTWSTWSKGSSIRSWSAEASIAGQEESKAGPGVGYELYMWGTNQKGSIPVAEVLEEGKSGSSRSSQLLNSKNLYDHPMAVDLEKAYNVDNKTVTIESIHCGPSATACLLSDGTCYLHGDNSSGQLGNDSTTDVLLPQLLTPPDSSPLHFNQIKAVSLGSQFSALIDSNGDLYTFGFGGSVMKEGIGNLGHGDGDSHHTPTLVQSLVEDGVYASQVAVGNAHMTVLTDQGEVLTAGAGSYGRLGNLETFDQLFLEPVELLQSEQIVQIASGKEFSAALNRDGIVFCWGRNDKGQCGTGAGLSVDVYAMENIPQPVEGMLEGRKVTKVSTGYAHAAAITDQGELFMWGSGRFHQPELMRGVRDIVDVSCGRNYTLALDRHGKIYTFGKGKTGVLGLASEKNIAEPTLVEGLAKRKVAKISAGWSHVACLVNPTEDQQ